MEKKDEMIMRLVHYFVTEENYSPMVVNGVKDEIWLQNQEGPYKIIRINANYIHNEEQYRFDMKNLIPHICPPIRLRAAILMPLIVRAA